VGYRPGGLTEEDYEWFGKLSVTLARLTNAPVLSPAVEFLRPRLVSPDGKVGLAVVGLHSNFISAATKQSVERAEEIARSDPPEGLTVEITGTAGLGRDYALHTARAVDNTTWVTIIAVLVILVLVYKSPFGALVPLVSIGASVVVAFIVLAELARLGWNISDIDRIFVVVLIFGAGVDYALFWISRYRESLQDDRGYVDAAVDATRSAGPSILASAATTICGLSCMIATDLVPTRSAGRILAVALCIALLAALTLSPSLARVLSGAMFWPIGARSRPGLGQRVIWPTLAGAVTRRPWPCLTVGTLCLGALALAALAIEPRFDSLSELPPGSSSKRGFEIAQAHFKPGQLYSNALLIELPEPPDLEEALELSRKLTRHLVGLEHMYDVYSLSSPLGERSAGSGGLMDRLLRPLTREFYYAPEQGALRIELLVDAGPFSPAAMKLMEQAESYARELLAARAGKTGTARVLMSGPTPYVIGVREVAGRDLRRVMILASVVIAVIVFALIRDLPLTLFMLLATWLTFGATLTLTQLFFVEVMGSAGLDWKVRLIVFVIVVAVGQDYNIFLVTRLMQEPAERSDVEAARDAIIRTGAVISSCGLIMAATLGSLWAGRLALLQQAGFALALGILIDTFFVRPLLIPSFFLATHRRRRREVPVAGL
jgi:RND superfamily putative drug exporter